MVYVAKLVAERFWAKVFKGGPVHPTQPALGRCWDWTRSTRHGYGQFYVSPSQGVSTASRYAYVLTYGEVSADQVVRHSCDRPICVNPAHLLVGTQADNVADTQARGLPFGGKVAKPGESHPGASLTWKAVRSLRQRRAAGESVKSLMAAYNLGQSQVYRIIRGQSWSPDPTEGDTHG